MSGVIAAIMLRHMDRESNLQCKHGCHFYHKISSAYKLWLLSILSACWFSIPLLQFTCLTSDDYLDTSVLIGQNPRAMFNGDLRQVTNNFSVLSQQIWRPFSATLYFPVGPGTGFLYLVNLYFLYQYSSRLETGSFFVPKYIKPIWIRIASDWTKKCM